MSEKIYDAGGAINSGVHEEEFGFERWTFILAVTAIDGMIEKGNRMNDPEYIKELPGRFWMHNSRVPSRYEVAELKFKSLNDGRAKVTALIRRGHWVMAEFFRNHDCATATRDGSSITLICECCENHAQMLPLSSFPEFPK